MSNTLPNEVRGCISATYTFADRQDGTLAVIAHVQCGPLKIGQTFDVAYVHDQDGENPGLQIATPLGINAVEDICAIIRQVVIGKPRELAQVPTGALFTPAAAQNVGAMSRVQRAESLLKLLSFVRDSMLFSIETHLRDLDRDPPAGAPITSLMIGGAEQVKQQAAELVRLADELRARYAAEGGGR